MNQFWVVSELRIDYLDVLSVPVTEKVAKVVETSYNMGTKLPYCHALRSAYFAAYFVSDDQNGDIKVISALTDAVCYFVYFAYLPQEPVPEIIILFIACSVQNATPQSLLTLVAFELLHNSNRISDKFTSVGLYCHELGHVCFLIDRPVLIELLKQTLNFSPVLQEFFWCKLAKFLRHRGFCRHYGKMELRDLFFELLERLIHHVTLL